MASLRKRGKVWYFKFVDADGRPVERKGCSDKRVTEEMARHAESASAAIRSGLIDPKARRWAEAAKRPTCEHLDDFIQALGTAGRDPQYVATTRSHLLRIVELAKVERTSDLVPSALALVLKTLRSEGYSARTLNAYATSAKMFSRWLWKDGRCADYALAVVAKPANEQTDRRLVRRPLSDDELRRLLATTRTAPTWRGVRAEDRALLYTIAAVTGLRRGELKTLTPASFRLDDVVPVIAVEPAYTKNHKLAEQPIPPALVPTLRTWLAAKPADAPLFAHVPQRTGLMLKLDLKRCGIAPVDPEGRVVDLHSLRHGYISSLAKAGVPIKTLQTLARHSDPKLTLNVYSHLSLFDTASALSALPDLTYPADQSREVRATGTDATPIKKPLAPFLPLAGDVPGRVVACRGAHWRT